MKHIYAILISGAILTIQLFIIGSTGPGDSEAYYYSWSKNLSLSYYDHPAGIALLIRLSTLIFGDNTFGLRFFSTLLINLSLIIIYSAAYLYYKDTKISLSAMLYIINTPAFLIGGVSASPEPALIFFSSLSIFFFYLYYRQRTDIYLTISFILIGLALNIKYSAIFVVAAYIIVLIKDVKILKRTLIKLIITILIFATPVIIWNLSNHGISFEYHLIKRLNPLYLPLNILKFIGGQLLYFNPVLVILTIYIIYKKRYSDSKNIFLTLFWTTLSFSALPMLLIKDSEPHWSSLVYICAAILFAKEIQGYKKFFYMATGLNSLIFGIFLFHIFSPVFTEGILNKTDPKYDITNELFGWDIVGENIDYIVQTEGIRTEDVLVASNHYTMSGQLMFATRAKYDVVCRGKRCNQFSLNDLQDESKYRLFIFVTDNRFSEIPKFYRDEAIQQKIKIYRGVKVIREFYLYVKKRDQIIYRSLKSN